MNILIGLTAFAAAVFVFELLDSLAGQPLNAGRLHGISPTGPAARSRRSTWQAVLVAVLPGRFGEEVLNNRADIVDLLRRSGYFYPTSGEFFAAAVRAFSLFLLAGGVLSGLLAATGSGIVPVVIVGGVFAMLGLRRPYSILRRQIRRRAAALRSNMLTGLAVLNAQLAAGVSVQEGLRRSAGIGGPFCNLLGLLVAQMEVVPFAQAVETLSAHLPDPADVEAGLFIRAVQSFYSQNRPLLPSIQGLQAAVHREVLEGTEARAALVRQRSGLFGVLAVLGLVITIIAPFVGVFTGF